MMDFMKFKDTLTKLWDYTSYFKNAGKGNVVAIF